MCETNSGMARVRSKLVWKPGVRREVLAWFGVAAICVAGPLLTCRSISGQSNVNARTGSGGIQYHTEGINSEIGEETYAVHVKGVGDGRTWMQALWVEWHRFPHGPYHERLSSIQGQPTSLLVRD